MAFFQNSFFPRTQPLCMHIFLILKKINSLSHWKRLKNPFTPWFTIPVRPTYIFISVFFFMIMTCASSNQSHGCWKTQMHEIFIRIKKSVAQCFVAVLFWWWFKCFLRSGICTETSSLRGQLKEYCLQGEFNAFFPIFIEWNDLVLV